MWLNWWFYFIIHVYLSMNISIDHTNIPAISCSGTHSGDLKCLTSDESCSWTSTDQPNSSVSFTFYPFTASISKYEIVIISGACFHSHWFLEGSNDGNSFSVVEEREEPMCSSTYISASSNLVCHLNNKVSFGLDPHPSYHTFRIRTPGSRSCEGNYGFNSLTIGHVWFSGIIYYAINQFPPSHINCLVHSIFFHIFLFFQPWY